MGSHNDSVNPKARSIDDHPAFQELVTILNKLPEDRVDVFMEEIMGEDEDNGRTD
jgi:hypothetical protein